MPNYSNGVIYKIIQRNGEGQIYIGSTCVLNNRVRQHKDSCNRETSKDYNQPVYQHIRANGGWINWEIQILEEYPCGSKAELEIRERYWIEKDQASLNQYRPACAALAGGRKEAHRQYDIENAERLREYRRRRWAGENKEQAAERGRLYRQENREALRERKARYYQENKERQAQKQKEPITCDCGMVIQRMSLARHKRTKYHLTQTQTPTGALVPTPTGGLGGVASGVGTNIEGKTVSNPIAVAAISARGSAPP
jgi:hypothetical protein